MTEEEIKTEDKSTESLIAVADRIEKANTEMRALLTEQKELAARNLLGGVTNAGVPTPAPKEETPAEYSKRIMSGKV